MCPTFAYGDFMLQSAVLETAKKEDFPRIYEIMSSSFPQSEMRSYEGQLGLLDHRCYKIYVKRKNGVIIAFLAVWEFDEVNFIEHFAVDSSFRGGGIGSKMLKEYLGTSLKPIILEVEPPKDEISVRRIEFYKKLGFHLNMFEYFQPPLQPGQKAVPLKIMTYPNPVDEDFFNRNKKIAYEVAYSAFMG